MNGASFEKKHVLVISNEPRTLVEIKVGLMNYFDVSITAAGTAALAALKAYSTIAAIIIYIGETRDKAFSEFSGISEAVKEKRIPVIFLAENDDEFDEIAALAIGAADYVVKRRGTYKALVSRIHLRIRASHNEKLLLGGDGVAYLSRVRPEELLEGKTILIAEDIELNRDIIGGMLSDIKGLTLEFAVSGKEAVKKFAQNPDRYSLIFMDVQMPEMDGWEATRVIRGLDRENAREIPIIALTASIRKDEITFCLEAGMNDFIEKPMAYDKFLEVAVEYCAK